MVIRAFAGGFLAFACLPSISTDSSSPVGITGDHLYSGVLAGGSGESGTMSAIYLDPKNAGALPAGAPSAPRDSTAMIVAQIKLGSTVAILRGAFTNGQAQLTGDGGWSALLKLAGDGTLQGKYTGGSGEAGNVAAIDNSDGTAKTLCGTYDGSDSGTWNFVISDGGSVAGSFYGFANGNLSGSVGGDTATVHWAGEAFGPVTGTASGSLSPDHTSVTGTWQSDDGQYSGTFKSDTVTCGAPEPSPQPSTETPSSGNCPCSHAPIPAGGACCQGGPAGSYCCAAFQ